MFARGRHIFEQLRGRLIFITTLFNMVGFGFITYQTPSILFLLSWFHSYVFVVKYRLQFWKDYIKVFKLIGMSTVTLTAPG
jgi:hypothetical protein